MKRRSLAYVILSLILALGWMGFQTWQSIHRYQEHYLYGHDEEHHDCQMCDWDVPLVEVSAALELDFVSSKITQVFASVVPSVLQEACKWSLLGRGPPAENFG